HRRGAGPRQPLAGAVPARRRVREPPARPGSAATGGLRRRHPVGERLFPPGVALVRSHPAPGADPRRAAAGHGGAARSGGLRTGNPGLLPGRAGRSLRLSARLLRAARLAAAPPARGRGRTGRTAAGPPAITRAAAGGRWRSALFAGRTGPGGTVRSHRAVARRDTRREGRAALEPA